MGRTSQALVAWTVALACVGGTGAIVQAQQPQQEPAQYRTWIARAVSEYEAGRWAEARANFRRAHTAFPNARTLRGIGMTSFELGEYVEAIRNLGAALEETQRPLTPEQRREVSELLERARTYTGRYRVRVEPSSVRGTVTVDGQPATLEPNGTLILDIGRREIVARAEGHESASRVLQVRGGEDEQIILALRATTASSTAATAGTAGTASTSATDTTGSTPDGGDTDRGASDGRAPATLPDDLDDPDVGDGDAATRRRARRSRQTGSSGDGAAIGLLITGGALAVGTVGSLVWLITRSNAVDQCGTGSTEGPCLNEDTLTGQRELAMGVTVGLGLAAAGAATVGLVLLSSSGDDEERSTRRRAALSCAPAGAGLSCRGSF